MGGGSRAGPARCVNALTRFLARRGGTSDRGRVKDSRWGKFLSQRDVTGSGGVEPRFSDPRGRVCTSKPPALRPHTPRRTHAPKPWRVFRCRCRFFLPFFQPVHADHARHTSGSDRQSRHRAGAAAVKISSRARSRQLSGLPLGLHFCGVSCCKGVGGIATL